MRECTKKTKKIIDRESFIKRHFIPKETTVDEVREWLAKNGDYLSRDSVGKILIKNKLRPRNLYQERGSERRKIVSEFFVQNETTVQEVIDVLAKHGEKLIYPTMDRWLKGNGFKARKCAEHSFDEKKNKKNNKLVELVNSFFKEGETTTVDVMDFLRDKKYFLSYGQVLYFLQKNGFNYKNKNGRYENDRGGKKGGSSFQTEETMDNKLTKKEVEKLRWLAGDCKSVEIFAEDIDSAEKMIEFLKQENLYSFPLNVRKIAKRMGFSLEEGFAEILLLTKAYKLSCGESNEWEIVLAKEKPEDCIRFSLMRIIGFWLFYRNANDYFYGYMHADYHPHKMEKVATEFAEELLMPIHEIKRFLKEDDYNMSDLANHFFVPLGRMRERLKNISESHGE